MTASADAAAIDRTSRQRRGVSREHIAGVRVGDRTRRAQHRVRRAAHERQGTGRFSRCRPAARRRPRRLRARHDLGGAGRDSGGRNRAASAGALPSRIRLRWHRRSMRSRAWDDVTAFVEVKRASLRRFGREVVLKRIADVLRAGARQVRADFVRPAEREDPAPDDQRARRLGAGAVRRRQPASRPCAAAPDFLFCNLERVPADATQLWPGPGHWAIYEVRDLATARHCQELGASYVESMTVRGMLAAYADRSAPVVSLTDDGTRPGLVAWRAERDPARAAASRANRARFTSHSTRAAARAAPCCSMRWAAKWLRLTCPSRRSIRRQERVEHDAEELAAIAADRRARRV